MAGYCETVRQNTPHMNVGYWFLCRFLLYRSFLSQALQYVEEFRPLKALEERCLFR